MEEKKKKKHIICFTFREIDHYHICPYKKLVKEKKPKGEWKKFRGLSQGRTLKIKEKILSPILNLNSILKYSMHSVNSYVHLLVKILTLGIMIGLRL